MTDLLQLPETHIINGGGTLIPPPPPPDNVGPKRQRRPSVRLGEIGDQTHDSLSIRRPGKGPRGRNPANFSGEEGEGMTWRVGPKTKRPRSNWTFPKDEDIDDDREDGEEEEAQDSPENRISRDFLEGGPSDTDTRNWNGGGERNAIRVWLNQLGLGRYAPVFEIHEVDDEVLPMLTIEDLKDMGINAVGSRRKMFCAIQKLSKGFS